MSRANLSDMSPEDFKQLLASVKEMNLIRAGKARPGRVFVYDPVRVKEIRKKLKQSQSQFAGMIGIKVSTLQNWEQGRRRPDGPALALLKVAQKNPEAVLQALHEPQMRRHYDFSKMKGKKNPYAKIIKAQNAHQ